MEVQEKPLHPQQPGGRNQYNYNSEIQILLSPALGGDEFENAHRDCTTKHNWKRRSKCGEKVFFLGRLVPSLKAEVRMTGGVVDVTYL